MAGHEGYNRQRLFVASCIALVTTAMAFSIRADILKELGVQFNISHEQQGLVNLMGIWVSPSQFSSWDLCATSSVWVGC
ncbi:hypothetical protein Q2T83_09960 [Fervidibacter sacchari]|jgi:hypothetical protein|uniref:Uncharacterized protein n=1 Tax=Candidatus Fervidibacter sacchari TaxID=1448929 RepID=A0ABT2ER33_9BACT|nr:hypothetical protein [Candidatus Fervidibacter sacchari]MCS3920376.1 hypothetical protein [Candidatus Fervidibacter sacchari]WKU14664.1 hypothetical protein Q2T83_09960 [Candidatus Fervidibacter sacchari]